MHKLNKVGCLLKRLHTISQDYKVAGKSEIVYRLWDFAAKKFGLQKKRYPSGWMTDEEVLQAFKGNFANKAELCQHIRDRQTPVFFFSKSDKKKFVKILEQEFFCNYDKDLLKDQADDILTHRFSLLGYQISFDTTINWHFSVTRQDSWPFKHWSEMNIAGEAGYGDIKPVWELNRHQHFFVLGRAYWLTGDKKYTEEFTRQVKSWIVANPAEMGINWQSNLEIALRSISWLWGLHFFLAELDDDTLFDILRVLVHSGYHMNKHIAYSDYCMHNNHLIGDAAGLALVGMCLPEVKDAQKWVKKGTVILHTEIEKQTYTDGVNVEQAVGYHRFVFNLSLMTILMEQLQGRTIPPAILTRLENMVSYIQWILQSDGTVPKFGDGDDGVISILGTEDISDYRPMLAMGAILFNRPDFKYCAEKLSEEVLWLLGPKVLDCWHAMKACPPNATMKAFSHSGYYIIRSGWQKDETILLFRNGPHSCHHSHADQLHIEYAAFGKKLLVDPGTYVYNDKPLWRDYFRGTSAHNTVVVDYEPQAIPYRSFRWLHWGKPEAVKPAFGQKVQWIQGGHTGYNRYEDQVIHRRSILHLFGEYTLIVDEFCAQGGHEYETLWHFNTGKTILNQEEGECVFSTEESVGLIIKRLLPAESKVHIYRGQTEPFIQGWLSPGYGEKVPSDVFSCIDNFLGSQTAVTLLRPFFANKTNLFSMEAIWGESATWKVQYNEYIDYLSIQPTFCREGLTTDAVITVFRLCTGQPRHLFIVNGSFLKLDGILSVFGRWDYLEIDFNGSGHSATVTGKWEEQPHFDLLGLSSVRVG